jgi:hypothetical protein
MNPVRGGGGSGWHFAPEGDGEQAGDFGLGPVRSGPPPAGQTHGTQGMPGSSVQDWPHGYTTSHGGGYRATFGPRADAQIPFHQAGPPLYAPPNSNPMLASEYGNNALAIRSNHPQNRASPGGGTSTSVPFGSYPGDAPHLSSYPSGPVYGITHTTTHTTYTSHLAPQPPSFMAATREQTAYGHTPYSSGAAGYGGGAPGFGAPHPQAASAFVPAQQSRLPRSLSPDSAYHLGNLSYEILYPERPDPRESPSEAVTRQLNAARAEQDPWLDRDEYSVREVTAHLRPFMNTIKSLYPDSRRIDPHRPIRELIAGPRAGAQQSPSMSTTEVDTWRGRVYPQDKPYREPEGSSSASGETKSRSGGSASSSGATRTGHPTQRFAPFSTTNRPDKGKGRVHPESTASELGDPFASMELQGARQLAHETEQARQASLVSAFGDGGQGPRVTASSSGAGPSRGNPYAGRFQAALNSRPPAIYDQAEHPTADIPAASRRSLQNQALERTGSELGDPLASMQLQRSGNHLTHIQASQPHSSASTQPRLTDEQIIAIVGNIKVTAKTPYSRTMEVLRRHFDGETPYEMAGPLQMGKQTADNIIRKHGLAPNASYRTATKYLAPLNETIPPPAPNPNSRRTHFPDYVRDFAVDQLRGDSGRRHQLLHRLHELGWDVAPSTLDKWMLEAREAQS